MFKKVETYALHAQIVMEMVTVVPQLEHAFVLVVSLDQVVVNEGENI